MAFAEVGIEIEWKGTGVDEKGYDKATGRLLVDVNPRYFRPAEVELLWGDSTKARTELGWEPKYSFMDLVKEMVQSDLEELKSDVKVKESGRLRLEGKDYTNEYAVGQRLYWLVHTKSDTKLTLSPQTAKGFLKKYIIFDQKKQKTYD